MSGRQVFISLVSREFGKVAEELRNQLQAIDKTGRTQLPFRQAAGTITTLSKLSQYIEQSDAVLALVGDYSGDYSGGYPSDASLDDPIHPASPGASPVEDPWRSLLPEGFDQLSYTQWEVILARFWRSRSTTGENGTRHRRNPTDLGKAIPRIGLIQR